MTSAPPIKVPIEPPKLVRTTTSRTRVTLLCQNPLIEKTSSDSVSKSPIFGRRMYAWTIPETQPAAISGCNAVNGAATKADTMANG